MTKPGVPCLQSIPAADVAADDPELSPDNISAHEAEKMVTQLYKDNGGFILSYVTGLLRDRYLAEDVVQETMLRAWLHCAQFSPEKGSVRGWLIRVAHNIAMDKIRMRQSRPPEVVQYTSALALVEDHADSVLTALQVRGALERLSPAHRAVIEQVYLHGCTAQEAAARLGIPEGTAFSRTFYGLRILRRELGLAPNGAELSAA